MKSGTPIRAECTICTKPITVCRCNDTQPTPHGTGIRVGDEVIRDIIRRNVRGEIKYGEPLTTHNGRSALEDAYEEALDYAQYLKQAILEEKSTGVLLSALKAARRLITSQTTFYDVASIEEGQKVLRFINFALSHAGVEPAQRDLNSIGLGPTHLQRSGDQLKDMVS
jgi:hypothetical protein